MTQGDVLMIMTILRAFGEIQQTPAVQLDQILERAKDALDQRHQRAPRASEEE